MSCTVQILIKNLLQFLRMKTIYDVKAIKGVTGKPKQKLASALAFTNVLITIYTFIDMLLLRSMLAL